MSEIILDPGLRGDVVRQPNENDIAHRGPRRLVKFIPMPGNWAAPAIWTGPKHENTIDGQRVLVRVCIVIVSKDPAETARITIPADFYEQLPDVPVEW